MSPVLNDIASSLLLPDGWAYLDWVSGVIRVNATYDELERLRELMSTRESIRGRELGESQVLLLETLTHEYTHYFQLCTTGYLYRVAKEFFTTLTSALPTDITSVEQLPQSVIDDVGLRLDAVKHKHLLTVGARGLDVLSIVESAAFLVQKRYHRPELSPEEYEKALAGQPSVYKKGYDIAREYLGNDAFTAYPLLASLALWTDRPVDSLVTLCAWVAGHSQVERRQLQFGDLLTPLTSSAGFIGPPWISGQRNVPEYEASVRCLEKAQKTGQFSRQAYLSAQHQDAQVRAIVEALPPVIFNAEQQPGAVGIQWPISWDKSSPEEKIQHSQVMLLLFAISTHVQRNHADRASAAQALARDIDPAIIAPK
jgi:hypothetical protein